MFQWEKKDGVTLLTVSALTATGLVKHGFTTRHGGVSEPPYHSLNMGLTVNDEPLRVQENRTRVSNILDFPLEKLVAAKQVHGDRVALISTEHCGKGALEYETALADTDALITAEIGVPISTYHADCVPLLIFDPVTPAIGLAHAGWKGTALKIGAKTIEKMAHFFDTKAEDCLVAIGPSIGPCCYEVDEKVRAVFSKQFTDSSGFFKRRGQNRWLLDLWEANKISLAEIGVPNEQFFGSGCCTACRVDSFFSYRKEGGSTGRMAAMMMLQN